MMRRLWILIGLLTLLLLTQDSGGGMQPSVRTGYVNIGNHSLYYEETGSGEPLIMIHGGLLDRRMWDDQFKVFGRWARVIRYDVRNHGLSHGLPDTVGDHVDLARLMDALGIQRARLMGLSMGGSIAIDFALTYPGRVSALVLVSSGLSGYEFRDSTLKENEKKLAEAAAKKDINMYAEYFQRSWTDGPHRSPAQVDPVVRKKIQDMCRGTLRKWDEKDRPHGLDSPAISRLSEIHVPTLVVMGDLDMPGTKEIADTVCRDIRGARKVVIKGAAHMVNMEKPEEFNEVVGEFLSR